MRRLGPAWPLLLSLLATPLAAQTIRGQLKGNDGAPVAGAIVALLDSAGTPLQRVLSSGTGGYLLRPPQAGRYAVRVLRIGYPAFDTTGVVVGARVVDLALTLPENPITIQELTVAGGDACRADPAGAVATALLLDEVRKTFGIVELALKDRDLRFTVERFQLRRDSVMMLVADDSALSELDSWPVRSLAPELLRDHGFVQQADQVDPAFFDYGEIPQGKVWFGPDGSTLFSDAFLGSHCYRAVPDQHDRDRIGLAFQPARGRRLPDIKGTLWIRRSTLTLERLEYDYVNLPSHLLNGRGGVPGGTMEFIRLPRGLAVVSKWDVHVPVEKYGRLGLNGLGGWFQEGGAIRKIETAHGDRIY